MTEQDISSGGITASKIQTVVNEYIIGKNAERNRKLTYRRLADGVTQEKLAEEFEMSLSQVQRILRKTEPIVFKHLN